MWYEFRDILKLLTCEQVMKLRFMIVQYFFQTYTLTLLKVSTYILKSGQEITHHFFLLFCFPPHFKLCRDLVIAVHTCFQSIPPLHPPSQDLQKKILLVIVYSGTHVFGKYYNLCTTFSTIQKISNLFTAVHVCAWYWILSVNYLNCQKSESSKWWIIIE